MSEVTPKFEIEIDEETTLHRDHMVEHIEHGPMRVESIAVGPYHKTAKLKSEVSPLGLELTDEQLREQWGETISDDPFELHDSGIARFENTGISVEGCDIEVDLTVNGPEKDAERVTMHAVDQIVRCLQAVSEDQPPSECEGAGYSIDWEGIFEEEA